MSLHILLPLVLVPAILLGQLLKRFGLPVVVGQMLAGFLLGPAVFGLIEGRAEDAGKNGIHELAEIGLCVLLFKIGLETKLPHFLRVWRRALGIALIGMVLPFVLGLGIGMLFGWPLTAALFLGAALTPTSIGVTAAVLEELNAIESKESYLILGAAVVDDILGLLLLSVLVAATSESGSLAGSAGFALIRALGFLAVAILAGPLVVKAMHRVMKGLRSETILIVLAFSFLLVMAYLAEHSGLAAIIGSYAAGLAFSKRDEEHLLDALAPLTEILTPLFFVLVGSSIQFSGGPEVGWYMALLLVLVVAVLTKAIVPWLIPGRESSPGVVGTGLIPRGEVGLIFAQVGLTVGSLSASQ
ncbi:MAG: cation:proton antiporter, partial [Akkermansiaceae bacterium]|nr:cation:proton antiporter [Akkermansiaceae bacterium]